MNKLKRKISLSLTVMLLLTQAISVLGAETDVNASISEDTVIDQTQMIAENTENQEKNDASDVKDVKPENEEQLTEDPAEPPSVDGGLFAPISDDSIPETPEINPFEEIETGTEPAPGSEDVFVSQNEAPASISDNDPDEKAAEEEISENSIVSKNEVAEDVISENTISENEVCVRVDFPADIKINIDPYKIKGKEQIYSDEKKFINHGTSNVSVCIKDIKIEADAELKDAYELYLHTEEGDIPLNDRSKTGDITFLLGPEGSDNAEKSFRFSGVIKENSLYFSDDYIEVSKDFSDSPLKVSLTYSITVPD